MCAYYLGKDNTGDLSSVLNGAYTASSPGATGPGATAGTKEDCAAKAIACNTKCAQKRGGPDFTPCMNECLGSACGGSDGPGPGPGEKCEEGKPCAGQSDCNGGECMGRVVDPTTKRITPGKCNCTNPPGDKCKAKCLHFGEGTREYSQCYNECIGTSKTCDDAHPCPPPKVCSPEGKCIDVDTTCPEGSGGTALDGCPCGTLYNTKTGKCASGYKFVKRPNNGVRDDWAKEIDPVPGAVGTCECEKWITPGKNKGKLGEYKYPPEMQALMDLLLSRGKEFMGLTPGYSQEAQDKMFGRGFENVRGQETGQRQALESGLSRQGMLGTGAGQGMLNDLSWQTEGNVANLARDLFIGNEEKKKQDLLDYTTAAQSVLGGGQSYVQLLEAINSARRGEGSSALQALLAWLLAQQ